MKLVVSQQPCLPAGRSAVGGEQSVGAGLSLTLPEPLSGWKLQCIPRLIQKCVLFLSLILLAGIASAQPDSGSVVKSSPVEMATGLRSNGKIYVVVAVLVIILLGLIFYLIRLDRKITRLEKEENN